MTCSRRAPCRLSYRAIGVAAAVVVASAASASTPDDLARIRANKRVTAARISAPITIDGILAEPDWALAVPATDFYQQQPTEFAPAVHRTEVRFLYDDTSLYVGAMLYDDDPGGLIISDLKREFGIRDTDGFGVVLDTFHDRRNSYGFITNPGSAVRDTMAFDNGRRNDANWNGVWFVRSAIAENGWSVEMAIPFKTLRFSSQQTQEWGLNLVRVARRTNEVSVWSPVPRQFTHYRVEYAGTLLGIREVEPGRNLQVKPFATGRVGRALSNTSRGEGDGGVDVKWGITSSLVLDGSLRTDFSQVEADEQQINLTRFNLLFPEKREFFLESPANFQIGLAEPEGEDARRDILPYFSRRIGLSADGRPIPVVGGLRLTGRAAGQGIGLLTMQTESFEGRPGDTFTAARVTRNLSAHTTMGAFYFGREASGSADFNRVGGIDFRLTPRPALEVEAFAMRSTTAGQADGWAGRTGFRIDTRGHRARAVLVHAGESFRHDLGFVRRPGVATLFASYARVLRPGDSSGRLRDISVGVSVEGTADDRYRHVLTRIGGLSSTLQFADGGSLSFSATTTRDRLDEPFTVSGSNLQIGAGEYTSEVASAAYSSNKSARLSGSVSVAAGEYWTGHQTGLNGGLRFRLNAHLAASTTVSRSVIELPQGAFTADLAGFRLDLSFTPRMFLNAFIQHNGSTDTWLSNVRYNFIHRPLSDIYVVLNETRAGGVTRRTLLLKYTHLIEF